MLKKTILMLAIVALAATAFAHGDMEHLLGTVTAVSDHSLTVKTPKGEVKEVEVDKTTKVVRSEQEIALNDIHVGDRVVIHARKHDEKLLAAEVRLAPQSGRH
jgi:hypothetical protein